MSLCTVRRRSVVDRASVALRSTRDRSQYCTLLYVIVTTGVGMVWSTFTKTQVAAVFITAILTIQPPVQFAGLLQPVSTLEALPTRHFASCSQVIIYRGGGIAGVWEQFSVVAGVGLAFFAYSVSRFRKSIAVTK